MIKYYNEKGIEISFFKKRNPSLYPSPYFYVDHKELRKEIREKAELHDFFSVITRFDIHATPIICHKNKTTNKIEVLVADSVAAANPKFTFCTELYLNADEFKIYSTDFTRQADEYSCRLDALILAKRALLDLKDHPEVWKDKILCQGEKVKCLPAKWSLSFQICPYKRDVAGEVVKSTGETFAEFRAKKKYLKKWNRTFFNTFNDDASRPFKFDRFSYFLVKNASLCRKIYGSSFIRNLINKKPELGFENTIKKEPELDFKKSPEFIEGRAAAL